MSPVTRGLAIALITGALGLAHQSQAQTASQADAALVEATVFQAAIYGYPLLGMYRRMSEEVLDPATRKAPFDAYFHWTELATPDASPFPAPNNDTLYSTAWLDLRREPAILTMPDTKGRYYTAHIMDMTTETIANIGQRLNGTEEGSFAVVGPSWHGDLPPGSKGVVHCETAFAYVLLRVLVDGPEDVAEVTALQKRYSIASLSHYLAGERGASKADAFPPYHAATAVERMAMLNTIIRASPVRAEDRGVVASFAPIGVGPFKSSLTVRASEPLLAEAEGNARALIASAGPRTGGFVNGWRMPPDAIGKYGVDYLQRASVWDGGPLANIPEESFYPVALLDGVGQPLNGSTGRYVLRFPDGGLPPARAFWSLTMYRLDDKQLAPNPIHRYSIGNRTRGLERGPDGSLTIAIQSDPPQGKEAANWLPAPEAPFYMVLRLYGPSQDALSGKWTPPPVERLP